MGNNNQPHIVVNKYGAILKNNKRTSKKNGYEFKWHGVIPSIYDLRLNECKPYFKAFNQHNTSSCTSYAIAAAYMCETRKKYKTSIFSSPNFNYYYSRLLYKQHQDLGSTIDHGLQSAFNGIADSNAWPLSKNINQPPSHLAQYNALQYSVKKHTPLKANLQNFKKCLLNGHPFIFSFWITPFIDKWFKQKNFQLESNYILNLGVLTSSTQKIGGHACVCVGFDDNVEDGVFIIRNSWGDIWANEGHFYIRYADIMDPFFTNEFYALIDVCYSNKCVQECPEYYNIC
jgi:C1A family cysteine protease